jgi:hypothetical protein
MKYYYPEVEEKDIEITSNDKGINVIPGDIKKWYRDIYQSRINEIRRVISKTKVLYPRETENVGKLGPGKSCHLELDKILPIYRSRKGPDALNEYKFSTEWLLKTNGHLICRVEPDIKDFESTNFFKKAIVSAIFLYRGKYKRNIGIYVCKPKRVNVYYNILKKAWEISYNRPYLISDVNIKFNKEEVLKIKGCSPLSRSRSRSRSKYKNNLFLFKYGILKSIMSRVIL